MKRMISFTVVIMAGLGAAASQAQAPDAIDRCHQHGSTRDIVECLDKVTQEADRRLNEFYQKALKIQDPSGVTAFRAAERSWLDYRKQRCAYLTTGGGTIVQILGADCMATMTKARADELEGDSKGLAGPG